VMWRGSLGIDGFVLFGEPACLAAWCMGCVRARLSLMRYGCFALVLRAGGTKLMRGQWDVWFMDGFFREGFLLGPGSHFGGAGMLRCLRAIDRVIGLPVSGTMSSTQAVVASVRPQSRG